MPKVKFVDGEVYWATVRYDVANPKLAVYAGKRSWFLAMWPLEDGTYFLIHETWHVNKITSADLEDIVDGSAVLGKFVNISNPGQLC